MLRKARPFVRTDSGEVVAVNLQPQFHYTSGPTPRLEAFDYLSIDALAAIPGIDEHQAQVGLFCMTYIGLRVINSSKSATDQGVVALRDDNFGVSSLEQALQIIVADRPCPKGGIEGSLGVHDGQLNLAKCISVINGCISEGSLSGRASVHFGMQVLVRLRNQGIGPLLCDVCLLSVIEVGKPIRHGRLLPALTNARACASAGIASWDAQAQLRIAVR